MAEKEGGELLIEPGWNEIVNTPERCREVLERVSSTALGVIYDPVSLLHPAIVVRLPSRCRACCICAAARFACCMPRTTRL